VTGGRKKEKRPAAWGLERHVGDSAPRALRHPYGCPAIHGKKKGERKEGDACTTFSEGYEEVDAACISLTTTTCIILKKRYTTAEEGKRGRRKRKSIGTLNL